MTIYNVFNGNMEKILVATVATVLSFSAIAEVELSVLAGSGEQESKIASPIQPLIDSPNFSEDDTSLGLRVTFPIMQNVAIDATYYDFGEVKTTFVDGFADTINDTSEVKGFGLGVKGSLEASPNLSFVGRLGLMRWDHDLLRVDSSGPTSTASAKDTDVYYGVGVEYKITDSILLGLEYMTFGFDYTLNNVNFDYDINNLALSVGYKF